MSIRSLCFSAFRAGGLRSLLLRPSRRSFSGAVWVGLGCGGFCGSVGGPVGLLGLCAPGGRFVCRFCAGGPALVALAGSFLPGVGSGRWAARVGSGFGLVWLGGGLVGALCGFTGSRSLGASFSPLVASVVSSVSQSGLGVAVGCAAGADRFVRQAAAAPLVFSVASGRWGVGRSAFAARSQAMVRAVAASGPSAQLVGFVAGPCPAGVVPAASWRSGRPVSGSWSTLALAAGLGVSVVVFPCGWGWSPPSWPGRWVVAGPGVWAQGWRFVPAASQLALF